MEFMHAYEERWTVETIDNTARKFIAAVKAGDGATAHFRSHTINAGGYVVGGAVPETVIPVSEFDGRAAFYAITKAMKSAEVNGVPLDTLGVWVDDGLAYVDGGIVLYDLEIALAVARDAGELAIYNRQTGECITVEPDATPEPA